MKSTEQKDIVAVLHFPLELHRGEETAGVDGDRIVVESRRQIKGKNAQDTTATKQHKAMEKLRE